MNQRSCKSRVTRREFVKKTAALSAGSSLVSRLFAGSTSRRVPERRSFGRIDFDVTSLGLGGQGAIQWTPDGVDPVAIIEKAYHLGVNYFDTSNAYAKSQLRFGTAFRNLGLVPGTPKYSEKKRQSVFLTTKTGLRLCKGQPTDRDMRGFTNGPEDSHSAVDDVRRSLTQIFGDGKGAYPKEAYLDMVLLHALGSHSQVNYLYAGIENTRPDMEVIGALAGLRDLRDGTNLTGLNPKEEKLIRHIGFSGHRSPSLMMTMIRRDKFDLLDGMLVAINANDRLYENFQYNTIPVARAKNMGVIGMKVFSDGTMYGKGAHFSSKPDHVVRNVGSPTLPSRRLIEYSLSTPGVCTAITGIGQISADPGKCQVTQNLSAAQIAPESLSPSDRREIESLTRQVNEGETNYFQHANQGLTSVANLKASRDENRSVRLQWDTATAGDEPISHYEILRGDRQIGRVPHTPQTSETPFEFIVPADDNASEDHQVVAVDTVNRRTAAEILAK